VENIKKGARRERTEPIRKTKYLRWPGRGSKEGESVNMGCQRRGLRRKGARKRAHEVSK